MRWENYLQIELSTLRMYIILTSVSGCIKFLCSNLEKLPIILEGIIIFLNFIFSEGKHKICSITLFKIKKYHTSTLMVTVSISMHCVPDTHVRDGKYLRLKLKCRQLHEWNTLSHVYCTLHTL